MDTIRMCNHGDAA